MKTVPLQTKIKIKILNLTIGFMAILLTACKSENPTIHKEIALPDAVMGEAYYTEVKLPDDLTWNMGSTPIKVFPNRYADIEQISPDTISVRHRGDYHKDEQNYGIYLELGASSGGGSLYQAYDVVLTFYVHHPKAKLLELCRANKQALGTSYDCSEFHHMVKQAYQKDFECETNPKKCGLDKYLSNSDMVTKEVLTDE